MLDIRRHRRLLVAVYLLVLLAATLAPLPRTDFRLAPSTLDKLGHFALFGGLAFLLYWSESFRTLAGAVRSLLIALAVAALVEGLQSVLPFRHGDVKDFVAGAGGALIALAAARIVGGGLRGRQEAANSEVG